MKSFVKTTALMGTLTLGIASPIFAQVPDLTKDAQSVDRKLTYNLGATGLRGWIYTKAADNLDAAQGRTTLASRQILVTHVGVNSPADGVVKVDDVILGAEGKLFNDDARKSFALAIQEAEKEAKDGVLKLVVSRGGAVREVTLKLAVMGTYSDTAPWNCAKSKRIFEKACEVLDKEELTGGSFTYDGDEQYGPGRTDDDTYYGKSGYNNLSPAATYVLTYALPLRKLVITGRDADESGWLDRKQTAAAVASGRFDLDRHAMSPEELVAAFGNWSPIVRSWAAEELSKRPESKTMIAGLIKLADGGEPHQIQGACETLGLLNTPEALPVLVKQLAHPDRWVRYKAAAAIKKMGGTAKPALESILKALVSTAEPLSPIRWEDPVQFAHGELAGAVFNGPLKDELNQMDPRLRYAAIRSVSTNPDGAARATLENFFQNQLSQEDVIALAPVILAAVENPSPADTMFNNSIRMAGLKALAKYHFKECLPAAADLAYTQGGWGSQDRTGVIMNIITSYGKAGKPQIPALRKVIENFNRETERREFPSALNLIRVGAVEEAIRSIETATTQPEMRSVKR